MIDVRNAEKTVKLLSSLATMGAIEGLASEIEKAAQVTFVADFGPTVALMERIRAGEKADLVILTVEAVRELTDGKILSAGKSVEIAASLVGMAVAPGTPKPNIDSAENLKRALLGAKSIAYSKFGASGIFFAGLLQRLGIAKELESRSIVVPSGLTGAVVMRGEAELAIQQISELMAVPGIDIVGSLPAETQSPTRFSIGVFGGSSDREPVRTVQDFLISPRAAAAYRATGLQPA